MPKTTKKYTEVMSTVMPTGTDARINALKPDYVSRSAYLRELLTKAIEAEEGNGGGARKLRTQPVVEQPCAGIFEDQPGSNLCGGCGEPYEDNHYRH